MVRHTKKAANQTAFLNAYKECACILKAAKAAGIERDSHYRWMRGEPDYAERFAEARKQSIDVLSAEALRRAKDGTQRMKFHQGVPCMVPAVDEDGNKIIGEDGEQELTPYIEHDYSDTLLIFLMKAADPARYNDRLMVENHSRVDHNVTGQVDVRVAIQAMQQDPLYVDYLNQRARDDARLTAPDGGE